MAGTPHLKVYNPRGEYVAACKHPEDAGAIVALYGNGAEIRYGHGPIVWREGSEKQRAGESFDWLADLVTVRIRTGEFPYSRSRKRKSDAPVRRHGAGLGARVLYCHGCGEPVSLLDRVLDANGYTWHAGCADGEIGATS